MNWKLWMKKLSGDKGYYLALTVCTVAVAVSGWLFVRSLRATDDELRVPEAVQAAVLPTLPAQNDRPAAAPADTGRAEQPVAGEPETEAPVLAPEPAAEAGPATVLCRPVEGAVVSEYSMDKLAYNPTTRDWRTHAGLDLAAAEGTEVRAAAAGTVLAVYEDDMLGVTVTLGHEDGWVTHYANLAEEVAVTAGDAVAAGQVLGTVGRTALGEVGSEPHLHFAVYRNNVPRDPEVFLAG